MVWDPLNEIAGIQSAMNQLFDDRRRTTRRVGQPRRPTGASGWAPRADIYETPEGVVLAMELPGLDRDDVNVSVEDRTLTVSGNKVRRGPDSDEHYHRIERAYGSFTRSFTLPSNLKVNSVQAQMRNGILELRLPKREEAKPREIEITVE